MEPQDARLVQARLRHPDWLIEKQRRRNTERGALHIYWAALQGQPITIGGRWFWASDPIKVVGLKAFLGKRLIAQRFGRWTVVWKGAPKWVRNTLPLNARTIYMWAPLTDKNITMSIRHERRRERAQWLATQL